MIYLWLAFGAFVNAYVGLLCFVSTFTKKKRSPVVKKFAIFCLFMSLWALGYFFPLFHQNEAISLLSFQLLHIGAIFIAVAHLDFVVTFLRIQEKFKKIIWGGYAFNVLILASVPTKFFIESMSYKFNFAYWANPGPLYSVWLFVWLLYIALSIYLLYTFLKKSEGIRRQQIMLVFSGDLITFAFGSTNFFLFYDLNVIPYFNILASGQMLLFAYAIAKYRFSNIKLNFLDFLHKTISFLATLVSIYLVYFYVNHFYPVSQGISSDIAFVIVALIFYHFFEAVINRKYFAKMLRLSDHDKFCETLENFLRKHTFDSTLDNLESRIDKTFIKKLDLKGSRIEILKPEILKKTKNLTEYYQKTLSKNPFVYSELELQANNENKYAKFQKELKKFGELILPIYNAEKKLIAYFILGKKPFGNPFYYEEITILKDICYYLSLSLSVINYHEDLSNQVAKKTKILRHRNQQLKNSYERLQELDNVKDEFLSIASHELRTPLSIIKGYTDFLRLQDFGPLNEKQSDFVEKIFSNTNDLIALINKMLDISRLESGQMNFYPEKIKLKEFVKNVREEFKIVYDQKKIKLTISNPDKLNPTLFLDREKLNIIFTNLLGNAYKFTPEGKSVKILIEPYKKVQKVKISIIDEGIGIPKDKQKLVFNKFQQAENHLQKMYSGTGLGLNITKIMVEKFGGKIWIESEDKIKKGTAFIFTLPYTKL